MRKNWVQEARSVVPYKTLPGSDFMEVPDPKDQAVALIFGQEGHGKTTLGLKYAPGPVAFFDIDRRGLHAAKQAKRAGKIIHYRPLEFPRKVLRMSDGDLMAAAEKQVSMVRRNLDIACKESDKGNVRTIVFDTMTEFCSLVNMAVTGRADRKKDDYGKSTDIVKTAVADIIRTVRDSQANLIMLARAKEIWEDNKPTGHYTYRGLDTLAYDADWAGHLRLKKFKSIKIGRRSEDKTQHELEITKAGIRLKTLGEIYTEEEWGTDGPFVYACVKQFRGSKAEDWK